MYAYQVMDSNEAYLYLGHAARSAMALGINRAQVVDGANTIMHRLRLHFWIMFSRLILIPNLRRGKVHRI